MDEPTTKIILGFIGSAWLVITGWTHHRASSAHDKLDERRKEFKYDVTKVYERIKTGEDSQEKCRQELEEKVNNRMTESQIKDFVDREVKSLQRSVDTVNNNVEKMSSTMMEMSGKMQLLLERDSRKRKND